MKRIPAAAMLCLLSVLAGCSKVPAGNVGVIVNLYGSEKGVETREVGTGRYWVGVNEELYLFPTFTQTETWGGKEAISFQTVEGMKVGGVRKVEVPPALWIDAKGSPVTKGLADSDVLEFDFELKFCKNPSLAERALDKIDMKMTTQNKILGGLIVLIGVYELIIAFAN